MAAQGPENTIKVKVIISKCGPDTSGADYTHLLSYVLFSGHKALISSFLVLFAIKLTKKVGEVSEIKLLPNFLKTFLRITQHVMDHTTEFAIMTLHRKKFPGN